MRGPVIGKKQLYSHGMPVTSVGGRGSSARGLRGFHFTVGGGRDKAPFFRQRGGDSSVHPAAWGAPPASAHCFIAKQAFAQSPPSVLGSPPICRPCQDSLQNFYGASPAAQCRRHRFSPGVGRIPGEGNGNSLQCACLGNPMGRGAWRATVRWVTSARTATGISTTTRAALPVCPCHWCAETSGVTSRVDSLFLSVR